MASNLPSIPDREKISPSIIRVLGGNPSKFTLQGTNTYLLGEGPTRILLDTGEGRPIWSETLSQVLRDENATVTKCILTHWHGDHVGGVKDLLALSHTTKPDLYKHKPHLDPDSVLKGQTINPIEDGQMFDVPSGSAGRKFEIKAIYSPGHTEDHMSFLITSSPHGEEIGSIFTGDNVLGHGTAVFEDLTKYLDSLAVMKNAVSSVRGPKEKKAFPGHGSVIENAEVKIDEYIQHRRLREVEALNVLMYGTTKGPSRQEQDEKDPLSREAISAGEHDSARNVTDTAKEFVPGKEWSSMEMVRVIYAAYPENLHQPAERGLLQVLDKLRKDGSVEKLDGGKWRAKIDPKGGSALGGKADGRSSL